MATKISFQSNLEFTGNYLLSSSKRLQVPYPFLPLCNQLKSALGPAGNRSSPPVPQPWPLHHRANCWATTLFSFYLIGFFHSETNVKELAAEPGIDPRSLGFEHHSTTVTFLFYLILFFHSWANLYLLNPFSSLWNRLKKNLVAQLGTETGSLI